MFGNQSDFNLIANEISQVNKAAERTRGAGGKILFGALMTSLFLLKNRWTVLQCVENTYQRAFNAF